jgi:hypothetical protein
MYGAGRRPREIMELFGVSRGHVVPLHRHRGRASRRGPFMTTTVGQKQTDGA